MLEKEITDRLNQALKGGKKAEISTLRLIKNEIQNQKIADRTKDISDEKIIGLLQKMARQHRESIDQFKQGGREDLVSKEHEELVIIEEYLPKQLSREEISQIVSEVIKETGASSAKDMGSVMKGVMARTKGQADGKVVNGIVKEKLT